MLSGKSDVQRQPVKLNHLVSKLKNLVDPEKSSQLPTKNLRLNRTSLADDVRHSQQLNSTNSFSQSFVQNIDYPKIASPMAISMHIGKRKIARDGHTQIEPESKRKASQGDESDIVKSSFHVGSAQDLYDHRVSQVAQQEVRMLKKSPNSHAYMDPVKHYVSPSGSANDKFSKTLKNRSIVERTTNKPSLVKTGLFASLNNKQLDKRETTFQIESVFPEKSRSPPHKALEESSPKSHLLNVDDKVPKRNKFDFNPASKGNPPSPNLSPPKRNSATKKSPLPDPRSPENGLKSPDFNIKAPLPSPALIRHTDILTSKLNQGTKTDHKLQQTKHVTRYTFLSFMDSLKSSIGSTDASKLPQTTYRKVQDLRSVFTSPKPGQPALSSEGNTPISSLHIYDRSRKSVAHTVSSVLDRSDTVKQEELPDGDQEESEEPSDDKSSVQKDDQVERVVIHLHKENDEVEEEERPSFRAISSRAVGNG